MTPKKKDKYRTRNWKEYNASLVNRGSITFWFEEKAAEKWYSVERTNKPGRPETYSDKQLDARVLNCAIKPLGIENFSQG